MSDDLVKRLREGVFGSDETKTDAVIHSHMQEAADEIEAQTARIAELEAALRKISAWHPTIQTMPRRRIGELRDIANAALEGKGNE